jgi:hypothetical protein
VTTDLGLGNRLPELSNELRGFIAHYIPSVIRLEILLLIFEEQDRTWTAEQVDRKLALPGNSAGSHLDQLVSQGLIARDTVQANCYRFLPASEELGLTLLHLSNAYKTQRVAVLSLIFSNPVDRVRLFTETFRLIRGEGGLSDEE